MKDVTTEAFTLNKSNWNLRFEIILYIFTYA